MNVEDLLWNASADEIKRGYVEQDNHFLCLICGEKFEKGIIYPEDGVYYEAFRYVQVHIEKEHGSVFEYLINLDKKYTGLTDHQNSLIRLFFKGKSDEEVKDEMGIGSTATIRNHRFVLKEKERQAKVFLAIMDLLRNKDKAAATFSSLSKTPEPLPVRFNVSYEERQEILKKYFPDGPQGQLKTLEMKEKRGVVILAEVINHFEAGREYTEKEVNQILAKVYSEDYVTLRRYLIDYSFLDRTPGGSKYWVKNSL